MEYDEDGNQTPLLKYTYYPSRMVGTGNYDISSLPPKVAAVYKETQQSVENKQNILAGIGIRALIESICIDQGIRKGNLYERIDQLEERSITTKEGKECLHKLRGLGNDAAHEMKSHKTSELLIALKVLEHMLDGTYAIPEEVKKTFPDKT